MIDGATAELRALLEEAWELQLEEDPLFASIHVGDHRRGDRLPSVREEDFLARLERRRALLARLEVIDRDALGEADRLDRDIFARLTADVIGELELRTYLMPITSRSGFHVSFPELPKQVPLETVRDHENYIARLHAFGRWADEYIELMRKGIAEGYVLPRVVLEGWEGAVEPHIVDDPAESLLHAPFDELPDRFPAAERRRLAAEGRRAIEESVVPGYRRFLAFMRDEYVPAASEKVGCSHLPRGAELYAHRVRRFTTLEVTPGEVHETGTREVARIRGEMEKVIERTGFEGGFREFVEFLRTDPRFYCTTPDELLREVAYVLKKMDGKLPELFLRLPRTPYGIEPIPDYIAPKTTTAYYKPPAGDGSRAGIYAVNTYDLESRPKHEIEALSFHEAVPGHHLQIALQHELDLAPFRRFTGFTAFIEGWALYAERLGLEVGFYEDPYSDFGRLTYEIWRACRLVVDTGIHALGWTRQQAIDYMAEHTALTLHNIETEVDRYISWPGQALAYKIGELEIRKLRALAERELDSAFDLRAFHDVVLRDGAVPLDVLAEKVRQHIEQARLSRGRRAREG